MNYIRYIKLNEINPDDFIPLLNHQKTREHLIEHELFDREAVIQWVKSKDEVDSTNGCKVRAILVNQQLAGWCGIQFEAGKYEMAIVIDEKYWGLGKAVFLDVMGWAKELGHDELLIHFLHTRPEYKFLRKISKSVYQSELFGSQFTTYQLAVN